MKNAVITVNQVSKTYRVGFWGKPFIALDNLSLPLQQEAILGYLGPNGSGKTTTFKVLLGLIRPDSGTLSIFNKPAERESRTRIGFLPENPYFYRFC